MHREMERRSGPLPSESHAWNQLGNRSKRKRWDRGDIRRPTDVRGNSIGHDPVAPSVLKVSDSSKGDIGTPRERHVSVGMATGNVNPAEEALRDLSALDL